MSPKNKTCAGVVFGVALILVVWGGAQGQHSEHMSGTPQPAPSKAPARTITEELHKHGGVPPGWRFTFPAGNPQRGREVFAKLECYKCHEVKGEHFPNAPKQAKETGPELTGMGSHHPTEYFAESILNPNAVIIVGPGYTGPDGLSIMPDYSESLTVRELIDLVAYLKSLDGEHGSAMPEMPGMEHGKGH